VTGIPSSMPTIYSGWQNCQGFLTASLSGLTPDQLALSAAPGLRSIGGTASHMIGARARWFHRLMGEGGDDAQGHAALSVWDRQTLKPAPVEVFLKIRAIRGSPEKRAL
jgi:uncharacterized damage-inducible protein DinB